MKVDDCMCCNVTKVKPESSLKEIAKIMSDENIGSVPVCEDDELVGIVTDRDIILRAIAEEKDIKNLTAKDVMTVNPYTCECGCDVEEAEKVMKEFQVRRIPIMENGKVVGMLTLGDLALTSDDKPKEVFTTLKCICEE